MSVLRSGRSFVVFCLYLFLLAIIGLFPSWARAQNQAPLPPGLGGELPPGHGGPPPRMEHQPPHDAADFAALLPPQAQTHPLAAGFAFPDERPGSATFPALPDPATYAQATVSQRINPGQHRGISVNNGAVGVVVESNTFEGPADLDVTLFAQGIVTPTLPEEPPPGQGVGDPIFYDDGQTVLKFQMDVTDQSGNLIAGFDKPVRLAVDMRLLDLGEPLEELLSDGMTPYLAYQDPENPDRWIEVNVTEHQRGFISAEVMHFSSWEVGWRPNQWTLQWEPPQVNGFNGAATYAYGFNIPTGRRGLQPDLGLSYTSSALNGAVRHANAGTVATGWSLNEIAVVRTGVKFAPGSITTLQFPETFRLVFNGAGYKLRKSDPVQTNYMGGTRYYAEMHPVCESINIPTSGW